MRPPASAYSAAARSAASRMRTLEGWSEARPPVAGLATTMGHRHDLDGITAKDVHETEGLSGEHVPPRSATQARPCLGARRDGVNGPLQLLPKAMGGFGTSRGIPVIRGFRLLRCSR